jgi:hypothetical protein
VAERPTAVQTLDLWLSAFRVGHETIFDLHRELIAVGAADEHVRELFHESADIALVKGAALTRRASSLTAAWDEQSVLGPPQAEKTLRALERELDRIEPGVRSLQARHQAIARELRLLLRE